MSALNELSSWRIAVISVVATLAAGTFWFVYSPASAVEGLFDAARARDQSELAHRIDIESVRASFQEQLLPGQSGDQQDAWGRLSADIVDAVGEPVINTIVTYRTVSEAFLQLENGKGRRGYRIEQQGLNAFVVRGSDKYSLFAFRFERTGLSWVLTEQLLDDGPASGLQDGMPGKEASSPG